VLVEVAGSGVNRADLLQLKGLYPAPAGWPQDVPGLEFSGTVTACGPGCAHLRPGSQVFGIVGGGAHSTHVLTTEALCSPIPAGLDLVEAGGVPEVFVTAHDALVSQARLKPGERVLIHGVGSGVGTAAVQLARAAGASTVGTARTPEKLARAGELGLDDAVPAGEDMAEQIGPVDVVLDLVGGDYVACDVEVCRPRGRIVIVGLMAGASTKLDLGAVMRKRLELRGTVLRTRPEWEKGQVMAAFTREIVPLFVSRLLEPVIDEVVPLGRAVEAYDLLATNQTFGKVVLDASDDGG
jgi:NADPH:quinone reductase-like Zn-dependent oxidoreductase